MEWFSQDIAAAWQVVEHTHLLDDFEDEGGALLYRTISHQPPHNPVWVVGRQFYEQIDRVAEGETPAEAICRAALKAVLTRQP